MKLIDEKKFLAELAGYKGMYLSLENIKKILSKHLRELPKPKRCFHKEEKEIPNCYNTCLKDCEDK